MDFQTNKESFITGLITVGGLILASVSETVLFGWAVSGLDVVVYGSFFLTGLTWYAVSSSPNIRGVALGSMYFFGFQLVWYGLIYSGAATTSAPNQNELLFGGLTGVLLILLAHNLETTSRESPVKYPRL